MVMAIQEGLLPDELFDETGHDAGLLEFPTREGLNWRERREAEFLKTISRGVMLVTGKPRSGKDLYGVSLASLNKYYFDRPILLDFKPRRLFGNYTLFNGKVMMQEIRNMAKMAGVDYAELSNDSDESGKKATELANEWIDRNETQLKGAVVYLSELRRYCYNRNPHNPMNKFVGSLCTQWGHLDMLIIGTHIQAHEIDQYTFLNYVTHWAKCSWSITRPNTTDVIISRGTYLSEVGAFDVAMKDIVLHVDGDKQRDYLGGRRFYDLYNTKNMVNLMPVVRKEM